MSCKHYKITTVYAIKNKASSVFMNPFLINTRKSIYLHEPYIITEK